MIHPSKILKIKHIRPYETRLDENSSMSGSVGLGFWPLGYAKKLGRL